MSKKQYRITNTGTDLSYSIWTETLLSKFGFKCIMNKHDLCTEDECECLCHPHNQ